MGTVFKSWNELDNEIEHLFGTERYGAKAWDIDWMRKVVNHIRENSALYEQSPEQFNNFVTQEYLEQMGSWMPYLSGARACLININFVDKEDKPVEKSLVSKALKDEKDEEKIDASQIFVKFSVEADTLKTLNVRPKPKM